jgi:hypothetical protein
MASIYNLSLSFFAVLRHESSVEAYRKYNGKAKKESKSRNEKKRKADKEGALIKKEG